MPNNPFSFRPQPAKQVPVNDVETWGGDFECRTFKCHERVTEATYYREHKRLVWECPQGHVSKIEGVEDE